MKIASTARPRKKRSFSPMVASLTGAAIGGICKILTYHTIKHGM